MNIRLVAGLKTVVVTIFALLSMYICDRFDIRANFPLTLISTAVIFPIVFSIGGAYKRRESALAYYGEIKAHGRAIYFAVNDWLPQTDSESQAKAKVLLGQLMNGMITLFSGSKKDISQNEVTIYAAFSGLSRFIKTELKQKGLSEGGCSRCNQYLSKMMVAFENAKHIYQYRTPKSLRAYSDFFIVILPMLYGPYFSESGAQYSHPSLGYIMAGLFAFILCGLDRIQAHLENPFDQIGADDVAIHPQKFVEGLDA